MDWPVIGTVSAAILVAGAVTFEAVVAIQPAPPVKPVPRLATLIGRDLIVQSESAMSAGPGPAARPAESASSVLVYEVSPAPDDLPSARPSTEFKAAKLASPTPADTGPAAWTPKAVSTASASLGLSASGEVYSPQLPSLFKPAKLVLSEPQSRAVQWRVVVTANASYYNLGGHVDRAGIVDEIASSRLREALKTHRNFPQLPPDLRTHILTHNISLPRLAPYRGLLGMNDRTLEEEQAIRFERVASSR